MISPNIFKNTQTISISEIPVMGVETSRDWILETCQKRGGRIVSFFATPEKTGTRIYVILGLDLKSELQVACIDFREKSYPSLTPLLPEAQLFEREMAEECGITFQDHPWLKPVRQQKDYPFYKMEGDEIHEVAVGPVHAGIIEPGHFRFQCHGEKVFHLELELGYQHRGVEGLMVEANQSRCAVLAESIAGDTVIGHGLAFCQAIEALSGQVVSHRALSLRAIALELERLANHVGDLGALAADVGFLPASAYFGRLRGEFLNLLTELSGNRFGRSFLRPGGVLFDITPEMCADFKMRIVIAATEIKEVADLFFNAASVLARLMHIGVITLETAHALGLVGMAARASGVDRDVRQHYPVRAYQFSSIAPQKLTSGDVYARARIRFLESLQSCEYILKQLDRLLVPPFEKGGTVGGSGEWLPKSSSLVVSLVEGWRGEIAHVVLTRDSGEITRYKIVDPSFHNWIALTVSMRNAEISDFPLCNKSFNLSYAGHDL